MTKGSKSIFRLIYCLAHREKLVKPFGEVMRRVRDFVVSELSLGARQADDFGFNRVQTALETVLLAADETGIRGNVLVAAVADAVIDDEEGRLRAKAAFGNDVYDALTAFSRISTLCSKVEAMKSENFRNLLIAQANDIRVVLLLIARSVNVMRKIRDTKQKDAQRRESYEAAYLYAPLAHKLGLYALKSELEDLSLKYLEHDAYYHIKDKLNATKRARDEYVEHFIAPIREMLDNDGMDYHIKARTKSIHSIWQKMKKQKCEFEGVYDLFAIRIILNVPLKKEKEQCWKVFSLITARYESNLKRLRDWLTVPKSNGYESLHITVRGPQDKWVEVQIRTERMDEIAEHGLAAHWRYKGVKSSGGNVESWLADIRNALETGDEKLLSDSMASSRPEQNTYVFTPKGDLFSLPAGATVLDFAYMIHTGVGNRCTGAKIGGRNVSLRHVLHSGDTVEVQTSNNQTPKADWQQIVVSGHARSKIRAAVKELSAREAALAREQVERRLKNRKVEWDETVINRLVHKFSYKEANDFFKDISNGRLDVMEVIDRYTELYHREHGANTSAEPVRSAEEYNFEQDSANAGAVGHGGDVLVIDRNLKGLDFQMARCCNPVYGDDVFGFVTVSGGIKIHCTDCPNAPALRERFGYRIVKARWAGKGGEKYPVTLRVVGNDDLGIVNNITSIIAREEKIMLRSIRIDSNAGLFSGVLTVLVDDTDTIGKLVKKIKGVKGVVGVERS